MEEMQERPINPYRENTVIWSLMEGSIQEQYDGRPGWSDLTKLQIGEVLQISIRTVERYIREIKLQTGFVVVFCDGRRKRYEKG